MKREQTLKHLKHFVKLGQTRVSGFEKGCHFSTTLVADTENRVRVTRSVCEDTLQWRLQQVQELVLVQVQGHVVARQ